MNPIEQSIFQAISCARSAQAFAEARRVLPGGVNSPVRAYRAVGRDPVFISEGKGAFVTDLDGNEYVDYVASYGPLILGHAHDAVIEAIVSAAHRGTSFGMPTEAETTLAKRVIQAVASIDVVRFVNSGTEATMSAIRLARAATSKSKIIKFIGCYHGHSDGLLVQAGSGATTLGIPSSPGVPESITAQTLLLPFNDLDAVSAALGQDDDIAAIIVEPIAGNMGCIPPLDGYLRGLRRLCDDLGVILIFDEVMTGFRVAYGGAQTLYTVLPDLTCLGKVVGGGLPCAAYGGREELMMQMAPQGPVYQAGTLSGNPLAMAAGTVTLDILSEGDAYATLELSSARLCQGLEKAASNAGLALQCGRVGSMICPFFQTGSYQGPVENYDHATASDTKAFGLFFNEMLHRGIILPPSQFETWFVGTAHDKDIIDQTIEAAAESMKKIAAVL